MAGSLHGAILQLVKRREVIQDPERSPHRRKHEVFLMDPDIGHWSHRQVELKRLPMGPIIEGDEDAELRAGIK